MDERSHKTIHRLQVGSDLKVWTIGYGVRYKAFVHTQYYVCMIGHKAPAYISELQSDSHYQTSIMFYPMEQLLIRRCTDVQYFSCRVFDSGLDVEYKIEPFMVSDNQQLDT